MEQSEEPAEAIEGFIVVDKPKGPTSHQVDYWIRQMTGVSRVGHIGTLDPYASGVLVMALGKAARLIDVAHEEPKEYVGILRFHGDIEEQRVLELFKLFTDEIYQLPPLRSAVARVVRKRRIHSLELLELKDRMALFKVKCDSGTYIRTLCLDIGYVSGLGGNMEELRRVSTGPFTEEMAVTLQEVSDACQFYRKGDSRKIRTMVKDINFLFKDKPKIVVKKSALWTISHGSDLFPGGVKAILGNPVRGDRVWVVTEDNSIVGTGRMLTSYNELSDLKIVDFDRILITPPHNTTVDAPKRKSNVVRPETARGRTHVQRPPRKLPGNFSRTEKRENPRTGERDQRRSTGSKGIPPGFRKKKDRRRTHGRSSYR